MLAAVQQQDSVGQAALFEQLQAALLACLQQTRKCLMVQGRLRLVSCWLGHSTHPWLQAMVQKPFI